MLSPLEISKALRASSIAVLANWPHLDMELAAIEGFSERVQIAAAATIKVECPLFVPMIEQHNGDPRAYFVAKYWDDERVRRELGNLVPDDAVRYCGRGYIQLTGRDNYHRCGLAIGVDLLAHPELGLRPDVAAKVFVWFFKHCYGAANARNYTEVRHLVNGGTNGLNEFLQYAYALEHAAIPAARAVSA